MITETPPYKDPEPSQPKIDITVPDPQEIFDHLFGLAQSKGDRIKPRGAAQKAMHFAEGMYGGLTWRLSLNDTLFLEYTLSMNGEYHPKQGEFISLESGFEFNDYQDRVEIARRGEELRDLLRQKGFSATFNVNEDEYLTLEVTSPTYNQMVTVLLGFTQNEDVASALGEESGLEDDPGMMFVLNHEDAEFSLDPTTFSNQLKALAEVGSAVINSIYEMKSIQPHPLRLEIRL